MGADKSFVALEILVAKIQAQLAPDAEVIHNAHLRGRNSKTDRQIDVLVRQKIGQYEMLIVLDCKDYNRPVDVKGVEEFKGACRGCWCAQSCVGVPKGIFNRGQRTSTRIADRSL